MSARLMPRTITAPHPGVCRPVADLPPALRRLVEGLDRLPPLPDLGELLDLVKGIEIGPADLTGIVRFSPDSYCTTPVRVCERYEILCLGWRSGQHSDVHDHRGSCCCGRVVRGVLTHTDFAPGPDGIPRAVRTFEVPEGGVFGLRDLQIHRVGNRQPAGEDLVTLHVYAPPLLDARLREYPRLPPDPGAI